MGLELINISKSYKNETGVKEVLSDINLSIKNGEFLAVLGHSGCGKTTLINIIAGFIEKNSGKMILNGMEITGIDKNRIMVFQEESLFPWLNLIENVEFTLKIAGSSKKEMREIAQKYIELVNLKGSEKLYVHQLSGGMKQRAVIARALAADSEILLMDEPFSALDHATKNKLRNELLKIWNETKKTIIFVTHDVEEALLLADRIVIISQTSGKIVKELSINIEREKRKYSRELEKMILEIREEYGIVSDSSS